MQYLELGIDQEVQVLPIARSAVTGCGDSEDFPPAKFVTSYGMPCDSQVSLETTLYVGPAHLG